MADALPEMPTCTVERDLAQRIRHGQMITIRDLAGTGGMDINRITGSKIKVVDKSGELVAILDYRSHDQRLAYGCVFANQGA
jgi:hypothetical protein